MSIRQERNQQLTNRLVADQAETIVQLRSQIAELSAKTETPQVYKGKEFIVHEAKTQFGVFFFSSSPGIDSPLEYLRRNFYETAEAAANGIKEQIDHDQNSEG